MRVPPVKYPFYSNYKNSLSANISVTTVAMPFKASANKTATAGAGLLGAFVGAAVGFCLAGPLGAFTGGAIIGGITAGEQESENNDMGKSDNSTMFDGRDESSKI